VVRAALAVQGGRRGRPARDPRARPEHRRVPAPRVPRPQHGLVLLVTRPGQPTHAGLAPLALHADPQARAHLDVLVVLVCPARLECPAILRPSLATLVAQVVLAAQAQVVPAGLVVLEARGGRSPVGWASSTHPL